MLFRVYLEIVLYITLYIFSNEEVFGKERLLEVFINDLGGG